MSIISDAKEIAELVKKLGQVELHRKIVELEGEIIELVRRDHERDKKINSLEEILAFKERLSFRSPFYYAQNDEIPFCSRCWETDQRPSHLVDIGTIGDPWECKTCGARFPERSAK